MSSAARAERRRQERAAARCPAEDGLRLVYQREGGDCLRAAVATVLGIDYDDTPPADGYDPGAAREMWREWMAARGLAMRQNFVHAPAFLDEPWIACVPVTVPGKPTVPHAVVMRRGRVVHHGWGPNGPTLARCEVLASVIVGEPAWVQATRDRLCELIREGSPDVWALETQTAVNWHRANGREAEARAIEASIAKRQRRRNHAVHARN